MATIRSLFDADKDINRTIEKVISYAASQESRLKAEITEYWVTQSIEDQLRELLTRMRLAMESGGENEIGVWVSGFYGSGKSSFTKYVGFAFDTSVTIDGVPFIKHLQDRLQTSQVRAQLATVAQRFPAAVIMLDLASEMLAGATMEDVSTVLYYKVLQWAGYSRNLKVAALERRIEKDGRVAEFHQKAEAALPGVTWDEMQNDPLVVDELIPQLAHEMFPALFPTPAAFTSNTENIIQFENDRVAEMLDIVRAKSGKQHILFIVDEVGQYVASRDNLILNLDGLAKNLKRLGDGKVWIMATAQQTLTEDDPRAAMNSDKLFKLNDRFPIKVDLEPSDIREICYRRLLGKSAAGEQVLGAKFDTQGQGLRHNTKLLNAAYYESDFTRQSFINLYPFLPAHFDILLHLLGALAKSTGGIGLRSAIKVIQEILVDREHGQTAVADHEIGWLATTVTLYDALEKEIRTSFPSLAHAMATTCIRIHGLALHEQIAKSIAVLQILGNLPVNVENLASLMHPAIDAGSLQADVRAAVDEMLKDPQVPLGEKDGCVCFLSEKLRDIEQERGSLSLRSIELKRIGNDALRESFDPLPRTSLHSTLTVVSGLKTQSGSSIVSLSGESYAIQMVGQFVAATEYNAARIQCVQDSSARASQNTIFLLGRTDPDAETLAGEVYRCLKIAELHQNDPDKEVKEYCAGQTERAAGLAKQLELKLKMALGHGSFVFRGQAAACATLDADIQEAARKFLGTAAAQVFDRYSEAPMRAETALAEKFLRIGNPAAITSAVDPLGLVENQGGRLSVKADAKVIVSIRDYIDHIGGVEGKRLLDYFSSPPFGWSPDTVRYVLSAMLLAGELKLKVSGREVTNVGPQAIEALKTNKSFGSVGVALRSERTPNEVLARAAQRLTDLIGEPVLPLENEISKTAAKHVPAYQRDYAPLAEKLLGLKLQGVERVHALIRTIDDLIVTDASDAPAQLGADDSALYADLVWAADLKRAFENGLEVTIKELRGHCAEVSGLPESGIPGELRVDLAEDMTSVEQRLQSEEFYRHSVELVTLLTSIKTSVRDAAIALEVQQRDQLREIIESFDGLADWQELTQEEQRDSTDRIANLEIPVSHDLIGLRQLLSQDYNINGTCGQVRASIVKIGQDRCAQRVKEEREEIVRQGITRLTRSVSTRKVLRSAVDVAALIRTLQEIELQINLYNEIEISLTLTE